MVFWVEILITKNMVSMLQCDVCYSVIHLHFPFCLRKNGMNSGCSIEKRSTSPASITVLTITIFLLTEKVFQNLGTQMYMSHIGTHIKINTQMREILEKCGRFLNAGDLDRSSGERETTR